MKISSAEKSLVILAMRVGSLQRPLALRSFARWFFVSLSAFVFAAAPSQRLHAAGNLPDSASRRAQKAAAVPALDGTPISLLEAVRHTLGKSPSIQIEQKQTEISRAAALANSGAFDARFTANGSDGVQSARAC